VKAFLGAIVGAVVGGVFAIVGSLLSDSANSRTGHIRGLRLVRLGQPSGEPAGTVLAHSLPTWLIRRAGGL